MPVVHISPSVNVIERDNSGFSLPPSKTALVLIGEASKGPINTPTTVTSTDDFKTKFGLRLDNALLAHAAINYLSHSNDLTIIRSAYDQDITIIGRQKEKYTLSSGSNKMKVALNGAVTGVDITIADMSSDTAALAASKITVALADSGITSLTAEATDAKYVNLVADDTVKKVDLQVISGHAYDIFKWATTETIVERAWCASATLTKTDAPVINTGDLDAANFSNVSGSSIMRIKENSKDYVNYTMPEVSATTIAGSTVASILASNLESQRDPEETNYYFSAIDAKVRVVGSSLVTQSLTIDDSNLAADAYQILGGDFDIAEGSTLAFAETVTNVGTVKGKSKGTAFNGLKVTYNLNIFNQNNLDIVDSNSTTPVESLANWNFDESDPDNYIENFASNNSDYIQIEWDEEGIDYLDKKEYVLSGGQNGINDTMTTQRISVLEGDISNPELWEFNLIAIPGESSSTGISSLINFCENTRGDCFAITDSPFGYDADAIVDWHNGTGDSTSDKSFPLDETYMTANSVKFNSSYAAVYWPWLLGPNTDTGLDIWMPPSVYMCALYAKSDNATDPWFPPAGADRGVIPGVFLDVETSPAIGKRDIMYGKPGNNMNPIVTFKSIGTVVWGQKTLLRTASALDRVNVRRMVLYVEKGIVNIATPLLFKLNTPAVWQEFTDKSNRFLADVQRRYGLTDFLVVCDSTTNTSDIIDQNKMIGKIFLKPVKAIEVIDLYFTITAAGGSFTE